MIHLMILAVLQGGVGGGVGVGVQRENNVGSADLIARRDVDHNLLGSLSPFSVLPSSSESVGALRPINH